MLNIIWIGDNYEIKSSNGLIVRQIKNKLKDNFYIFCDKTNKNYNEIIKFNNNKLEILEYYILEKNINKIIICHEYYKTIELLKYLKKINKNLDIQAIISIKNRNLNKEDIYLINDYVNNVFFDSKYTFNEFKDFIKSKEIQIFKNVNDNLKIYNKIESKIKLGINENKFVIISNLNYLPENREDLLINSLISIILDNKEVNIMLIINKKYKNYIDKKFNENNILNINEYIYYFNNDYNDNLTDENLSLLLSSTDLGINTSQNEKRGFFILEQCKYGIPQIIPDENNLSNLINYGCIKIKPNNYILNEDLTESKLINFEDVKKAINIYIQKKDTYELHSKEIKKNLNEYELNKMSNIFIEKFFNVNDNNNNLESNIINYIENDNHDGNIILINPSDNLINNSLKVNNKKYYIFRDKNRYIKNKDIRNNITVLNNIVLNESNKLEEQNINKILSIRIDDLSIDFIKLLYIPKEENLYKIIMGCEKYLKNNKIKNIYFEIDKNINNDYIQIIFNLCLNNFIIYDINNKQMLLFDNIKNDIKKYNGLLFINNKYIPIMYFNNNKIVNTLFNKNIFLMNNYLLENKKINELKIITESLKKKVLNKEFEKSNLELLLTIYITIQNLSRIIILSTNLGNTFCENYEEKIQNYLEILGEKYDILVIDYDDYEVDNEINDDLIKVKKIINLKTFIINIKNKKKIITSIIPFDNSLENEFNKNNLNIYICKDKLIY